MNTQSGSQWDSLKHFAHQKSQMYYNGLSHDEALKSDTNGIHNICERGGIVGRGVLVDWLSWYEKTHGDPPSAVSRHEIPISELEECLQWQGTSTKPGDILLVRTGYTRWHNYASPVERNTGKCVGDWVAEQRDHGEVVVRPSLRCCGIGHYRFRGLATAIQEGLGPPRMAVSAMGHAHRYVRLNRNIWL